MKKTDPERIYRAMLGALISSGIEYHDLVQFLNEVRNGEHESFFRNLARDVRKLERAPEPILVVEANDERTARLRVTDLLNQLVNNMSMNEVLKVFSRTNPDWDPPKKISSTRVLVTHFVRHTPFDAVWRAIRDLGADAPDPYLAGIIDRDKNRGRE